MLESFRAAYLRRALRKLLQSKKRNRKTHTFSSARTIGILFDATVEKTRLEVLNYAKILEGQGKKVKLLGFVDATAALGQTLFPQFTPKERRWNGIPASDAISSFLSENFDLLLCLNIGQKMPIDWVAANSPASMKIGTFTANSNDFDMLLEAPAEKGTLFFIEQLNLYLNKIVPSRYESASAL